MNICERIKEERERLEYDQANFAALGAASRHSQIDWEKGKSFPNAQVLSAWAAVGADVQYILTGKRVNDMKSRKTAKMAELMEALDDKQQQEILAVIAEKQRLNELSQEVTQLRKAG